MALMFLVMKIKSIVQYMFKKCFEEKHVHLLLIGEENTKHYALIKNFRTFIFDHTIHCGKEKVFAIIVHKILLQKKY